MARTNATRQSINNLVRNGDFEFAPEFTAAQTTMSRYLNGTATGTTSSTPYGLYVGGAAGVGVQIDPVTKYSGDNSLKIVLPANKWVEVSIGLTGYGSTLTHMLVEPDTSYTMSARIKADLSGSSSGAKIIAYETTGVFGAIKSSGTTAIVTTTDWTLYTTTFTTAATTRFIRICAAASSDTGAATLNGTVWFDNITLSPTTPITRLPV